MHDIDSEDNILDNDLAFSPALLGKECICCSRALLYNKFKRDTSYRDGYRDRCVQCENAPVMSTAEHTARLREMNYNSAAVKKQRWQNQDDYRNDEARIGRVLPSSEFVFVLRHLVPSLYIVDGRIEGDLAVFQTYGQPQPDLEGRTFRYLFYIPTGMLPEYSLYEFSERDVPIREQKRGWRTVLLRLIKSGLLTEDTCREVFGEAVGEASTVWHRTLHQYRSLN